MAGRVSPGTIPPVSLHLGSFAWLIRADRTAAPNLQSAVTRGNPSGPFSAASRPPAPPVRRCSGSGLSYPENVDALNNTEEFNLLGLVWFQAYSSQEKLP
ncbi:hypothetical protein EYF80_003613 [Liparis tanakae]|uniref:Uncharacterized protein n=1 Tax=Liparis tanakae TaxID=230148 RepID=A0A4Z2J7M7_9TELE|nr:hypothetical protein EYF80_003613 [Liparis tanakae]